MQPLRPETPSAVLCRVLTERGVSQSELARRTGISPAAISYYCAGERARSLLNAARIAQNLGISLDQLATGREPAPAAGAARHLFLRGAMGVGKSGVLRTVVEAYPGQVAGFYAQRMLQNGRRAGFALKAIMPGEAGPWAKELEERDRLFLYEADGAWHFRPKVFETWGVACLRAAREVRARLLVIDEIGGVELLCDAFMEALFKCLEALPCLGVFKSSANLEAMAAKLPDAHRCRARRAACMQRLTHGLGADFADMTEDNAAEVRRRALAFARDRVEGIDARES